MSLSILALIPGYEFSSIYVSDGDVIVIHFLTMAISVSDPIYSPALESTHGPAIPLCHATCGRLLALDVADGEAQLLTTCKLF